MTITSLNAPGQLVPIHQTFGPLAVSGAPQVQAVPAPATAHVPDLSDAARPVFQALLQLNSTPLPVPVLTSAPSIPPSSHPQYVLPSNPMLVARLTETIADIASLNIYPAPVFSFSA